jgi:fumarylacetoacetase
MAYSWLKVPNDSDFTIVNVPFGVFSVPGKSPRAATILGDTVLDLSLLEEAGLFDDIMPIANVFCRPDLNTFIEQPKAVWSNVRQRVIRLLVEPCEDPRLKENSALKRASFHHIAEVKMHLPIHVGDYTDFYSSREHATNVGTMFRGKDDALQPNWLHLPVGYHGRASTVYVSPHNVRRPYGQLQKDANDPSQGSEYGPCQLMDFELEMAAVVGGAANTRPMTIEQAKSRIFGFLLMNDWSARDIQKWEYVPLGPFTSKNFATTVSPWIVTADALEAFAAPTSAGLQDNPTPLPYLQDPEYGSYDVVMTVAIQSARQSQPNVVCTSNFKNLYWNSAQQLAHHTVTGCSMKAGDLLGSGTISGSTETSFGSMLELSWKGSREVKVGEEKRKFLHDGDVVVLKGHCVSDVQGHLGFGECRGTLLAAETAPLSPTKQGGVAEAPTADRYQSFKLYGYWRSSSTWRVRVALAVKHIEYETIPIDLAGDQQKSEGYLEVNPFGQVPLLECSDVLTGGTIRLGQSIAIIDFLEEAFPLRKSLLPKNLVERAIARQMAEIINSGTQPLQNIFSLRDFEMRSSGAINAAEEAKKANELGLGVLEKLVLQRRGDLSGEAGPYCAGGFCPTIADICMVAQIYNASRFRVELSETCPALVEIDKLCNDLPCFKASHPDNQVGVPERAN